MGSKSSFFEVDVFVLTTTQNGQAPYNFGPFVFITQYASVELGDTGTAAMERAAFEETRGYFMAMQG